MKKDSTRPAIMLQAVFLTLCATTAIYYVAIGFHSKAYVVGFGAVEFLVALGGAIALIVSAIRRKRVIGNARVLIYALLCVMQLFPIVGAVVMTSGTYAARHVAMHVVVLVPGIRLCVMWRKGRNDSADAKTAPEKT